MNNLKPIETRYKGYHFRSRLEARWAVFFDSIGLAWNYEPEGFELSNGVWYLPDFWLPELDCWFEVKGPQPTDVDRSKALYLSIDSQKLVVLASGQMDTEIAWGWEWNARGFRIELFAGKEWDTWLTKSHDFWLHNYKFETPSLRGFIDKEFPSANISGEDTIETRKQLIELDRQYYKTKYGEEHPSYMWGRHIDNVHWVVSRLLGVCFQNEPEMGATVVSQAYQRAKSARF